MTKGWRGKELVHKVTNDKGGIKISPKSVVPHSQGQTNFKPDEMKKHIYSLSMFIYPSEVIEKIIIK